MRFTHFIREKRKSLVELCSGENNDYHELHTYPKEKKATEPGGKGGC